MRTAPTSVCEGVPKGAVSRATRLLDASAIVLIRTRIVASDGKAHTAAAVPR
jgi:hypothetical protein